MFQGVGETVDVSIPKDVCVSLLLLVEHFLSTSYYIAVALFSSVYYYRF